MILIAMMLAGCTNPPKTIHHHSKAIPPKGSTIAEKRILEIADESNKQ